MSLQPFSAQAVSCEDPLVAVKVDWIRELTQNLFDELRRVVRKAQDLRSGLVGPEIIPAGRHNAITVLPLPVVLDGDDVQAGPVPPR